MYLIALLGSGLEKLHSHPKFRMRNQDKSGGSYGKVTRLNREDDACPPRKRRVGRKITTAEAEVSETAIDGWIVLLRLRKLAIQPLADDVALLLAGILEADASLIAITFPSQ